MLKFLRKLLGNQRGNSLLIAAGAMPMLIGAAGLATDTIQWVLWKRQLQRAADSAAIAGVYQRSLLNTQTDVEAAVCTDLAKNQHTGILLSSNYVTCGNGTRRGPVTLLADNGTVLKGVQVSLTVSRALSFSGLFMSTPPDITANATAASVPGHDQYCLISLETNPSNVGIIGTGNASVEMDCGMVTNDPAANSAAANGSSSMTASVIASVGGIQKSNNWHVGKYDPYVTTIPDPYAAVTPQTSDMKCAVANGNNKTAVALDENTNFNSVKDASGNQPNCYSSLSVGSNKTLTLSAGIYYINGGNVDIQGTLTGTGVTIVLTNADPNSTTIGTFNMNAQANMTITAPTSGAYKDIAIYQDRRATDGGGANSQNKVNGGSASVITGALYFPKQELEYNGNGTLNAICTRFVTRRIKFSGNNTTSNKFAKDCGGNGPSAFDGGRLVRLVA